MTTKEIIEKLRSKSRRPETKTMWHVAMYILGKRRYSIQHIADAFGVDYYTVQHAQRKAKDLLDVRDEYAITALEELSTHILDLFPYYDRRKKIKIYAKIDNVKL